MSAIGSLRSQSGDLRDYSVELGSGHHYNAAILSRPCTERLAQELVQRQERFDHDPDVALPLCPKGASQEFASLRFGAGQDVQFPEFQDAIQALLSYRWARSGCGNSGSSLQPADLSMIMGTYFRNIYRALKTVVIGMRITLKYAYAKPITVQYPDVAPVLQKRFRGIHYFEIEKCIACDMCAKACPVDCIYIEKSGPRKINKETGIAVGGAMLRYAIDYSKCMFCSLCCPPCPTDCIHMGNLHDMSAYDRESMTVEFTELAKEGLQTPQPLWMQGDKLPEWAAQTKQDWVDRGAPLREAMVEALSPSDPPKAAKK